MTKRSIPAQRQTKRMKYICRINPSKAELRSTLRNTMVSFVPMENIGDDGSIALIEARPLEGVYQSYTYFRDNDVIIAKITPCFENGKGALCGNLVGGVGFGTTELHVLRAEGRALPPFVYYVMRSQTFRALGEASMQGTAGQKRVPEDFVRDFVVFLPPLSEQRSIADFLDRETARIDVLVAKKERLIELLQEKRTALITQAVTKGLDPDVPMKDSGLEWLGEIPADWEVKRLKMLAKEMVAGPFGSSLTKDMCSRDGYKIYGQEQVIPDDFLVGDYYIPEELFLRMRRFEVAPGHILVSCVGTFGKVAVVPETVEAGIINPRLIKLEPRQEMVNPAYLGVALKSRVCFDQIECVSRGGTMDVINIGLLSELWIPVPALAEQNRIVACIDKATAIIDTLNCKIRSAISLLKEYRTALISAAVTGKIDVRHQD